MIVAATTPFGGRPRNYTPAAGLRGLGEDSTVSGQLAAFQATQNYPDLLTGGKTNVPPGDQLLSMAEAPAVVSAFDQTYSAFMSYLQGVVNSGNTATITALYNQLSQVSGTCLCGTGVGAGCPPVVSGSNMITWTGSALKCGAGSPRTPGSPTYPSGRAASAPAAVSAGVPSGYSAVSPAAAAQSNVQAIMTSGPEPATLLQGGGSNVQAITTPAGSASFLSDLPWWAWVGIAAVGLYMVSK